MKDMESIMIEALSKGASDIFLIAGLPLTFKIDGRQDRTDTDRLSADETRGLVMQVYELTGRDMSRCQHEQVDDDFSCSLPGKGRFRVNVFKQRNSLAAVLRVIQFDMPDPVKLHIPSVVMDIADFRKGLVLITGAAGTGKSTTLSCLIDRMNHTREGHIITMEDPIEQIHRHDRCIITQREIGNDTVDYPTALRAALRETPDIILLGEMRDRDTMETAMTAAETGQLLLSTMHTTGAANTIDRVVDSFPSGQQQQIRLQLSMTLQAVVSQQLVPDVRGKMIPVFEIMFINPAIRNLIREAKTYQVDSAIQNGAKEGMCTMDGSLLALYEQGTITQQTALEYCLNHESMERKLGAE